MQKIFLAVLIVFSFGVLHAQSPADSSAPYKRFPTVPPFKLLEVDSVSFFSKDDLEKKKPVLMLVFSPDCEHCKLEIDEIIKHIDELKDVQIIMATPMPFATMKDFYSRYKIDQYKNIRVGHDFQYMLPTFYMMRSFPYLAMYNKKGDLISTFEGNMKMEDLIKVFN